MGDSNDVAVEDVREVVAYFDGLADAASIVATVAGSDYGRGHAKGLSHGYGGAAAHLRGLLPEEADCSGCGMPGGRHWDTCPNRGDGRPTR